MHQKYKVNLVHIIDWYSTESYFVVKQLIDTIPVPLTVLCMAFVADVYDWDGMVEKYLLIFTFISN